MSDRAAAQMRQYQFAIAIAVDVGGDRRREDLWRKIRPLGGGAFEIDPDQLTRIVRSDKGGDIFERVQRRRQQARRGGKRASAETASRGQRQQSVRAVRVEDERR